MKYIIGKDIENNINMLKLKLLPISPKYLKKSTLYPTEIQNDKANIAHKTIKLNGSFFERSIPSELKNFFPLNVTLFNLVIKYGTRVTDKKSIIILSKYTAICPAKGTTKRNNRLYSLSLVMSFLSIILSRIYIFITSNLAYLHAKSKVFMLALLFLVVEKPGLLHKRYGIYG